MLFNNRFINYFLLMISALSYALLFIFPNYLFWLSFIFLIPIFYLLNNNKLRAFDGILWTGIAFGLQAIGFFVLFFERTPFFGALLFTGLILLYFSCYTILWFYCISLISRYRLTVFCRTSYKIMVTILKILGIAFITTFYFYFFYYYILWPTGYFHGYVFSHPLLPFASHSSLLYPIRIVGLWPATMFLILSQFFLAEFFVTKKHYLIFFSFLTIFTLFVVGLANSFMVHQKICDTSKIFHNMSYIQPSQINSHNPYACAKTICSQIEFLCGNTKEFRIILMPESTFPFAFQADSRSAELLFDAIGDNTILIFGGHRLDSAKKLYNSLFCCYGRRIIFYYDKLHLMPFTEFTITSTKLLSLFSAYSWPLKTEFVPRDLKYSSLAKAPHAFMCKTHAGMFSFIPVICSDLFLGTERELLYRLKEKRSDQYIICITNDSWFSITYVRNLMRLYAHLVSQITNTSMIYVDHRGIEFFNAV